MTSGEISGFNGMVDDDGNPAGDGRGWIKTSAAIAGGNSGGTAVDAKGRLIGVPTRFHAEVRGDTTAGKLDYVRSIFIPEAQELIAMARNGWSPSGGDAPAPQNPAQTADASASVDVTGFVRREDNHKPIEQATVLIFKPGVRFGDLKNEDDIKANALSFGMTNADGQWTTKVPVPRGQAYTVAIVHDGFQVAHEDFVLKIPADAPTSKPFVAFDGDYIQLTPADEPSDGESDDE
jgi:hypothetical protein